MYKSDDTIVAVSSPSGVAGHAGRAIVRMTGPATIDTCQRIFRPPIQSRRSCVIPGNVAIDDELKVDAVLYLFFAPHSYTGDDVAEIHVHVAAAAAEALLGRLLGDGLRMAGPGEFTARAYLSGKIDLAQAEAVNEVVVSSNTYQLTAAENLLAGRLGEATNQAESAIMELLGLIEAGIDFSCEDIEFISRADAVARLASIKQQLERLASASVNYESVIDLPAVGVTGAPNAGKSSLANKLLGRPRSIVSPRRKTTRDVLTGELSLAHCRCVLFDCAGINSPEAGQCDILDELAQQAAIEALRNSSLVIFCVDVSKPSWAEDASVLKKIRNSRASGLIPAATKCDLCTEKVLADRLTSLIELFGTPFLPVSAKTGTGLDHLREAIDTAIVSCQSSIVNRPASILLTARHRQAVAEAIGNITDAVDELKSGNDEVAAMLLRAAYKCICDIRQPASGRLDEQILEQIFSRFCIGK